MMRALWTGASGMIAQQTNVDTIANNISNVNTTGYKRTTTEFQSLLYQKLRVEVTDHNGDPKPVIGQVGSGVKVAGVVSQYTQGALIESGNKYDMAIDGDGFFRVRTVDGTIAYTRNGSFQMSIGLDGVTLSNANGYAVLNTEGEPITFGDNTIEGVTDFDPSKLTMDEYGIFMYPDENGVPQRTNHQIGLAQFNNPAGLEKMSGSLLKETANSGGPRLEAEDTALKTSKVLQQRLEISNVQTVDEVVNLIVAQRAYEMNSKIITASDEMLQQANNLRN